MKGGLASPTHTSQKILPSFNAKQAEVPRYRMQNEKDLIARARNLDQEALAEIYDALSPGLYRYAMRIVGDAQVAEDCVGETFSRFLNAVHRGGGPQQYLKAYLYRVAHNWITDLYRKKGPQLTSLRPAEAMIADEDPTRDLEDGLERQRARQALAYLTPEQRQVVVLKYLEGWSNAEIAQSMGKTTGAVKSLQHRALATLQRLMLKEEQE